MILDIPINSFRNLTIGLVWIHTFVSESLQRETTAQIGKYLGIY